MFLPKERVVRSRSDNHRKRRLPVSLPGEEPPRRVIPRSDYSEALQGPEVGRVLVCVDQAFAGASIGVRQTIILRLVNVVSDTSELVGSSEQLVRLVALPPHTQPLAGRLGRVLGCEHDNAGSVWIGNSSQGAPVPSNVVAERVERSRLDNPCRALFTWGLYTGEYTVYGVSKREDIVIIQAPNSGRRIQRNPHFKLSTKSEETDSRSHSCECTAKCRGLRSIQRHPCSLVPCKFFSPILDTQKLWSKLTKRVVRIKEKSTHAIGVAFNRWFLSSELAK
ncbi:uncharacterized protein C8R40DRAFT_1088493 [Lentinula edodes]|uniref:uncharacterized protein n=1 Tax=Lentinula edodes TaxID=5353 RepID=UPI001E8EB06B|nr:uncharacterized protein C8R40DRAFT_1088493 [Lentinula edodes]KAH7879025.1 hypothetical protein C8R40DRAFT_1088493 [Lentinula edodes]